MSEKPLIGIICELTTENLLRFSFTTKTLGEKWAMSTRFQGGAAHNSILFDVKWGRSAADGLSMTRSLEINASHHLWFSGKLQKNAQTTLDWPSLASASSFLLIFIYIIIKENWLQFLLLVKATALKPQVSKLCPQIQRTYAKALTHQSAVCVKDMFSV